MAEQTAQPLRLKGGGMETTTAPNDAYAVVSGHVLVYAFPLEGGRPGRRLLLHEALPGQRIPALCEEAPGLGAWRFGLVALDEAVVERLPGGLAAGDWESFFALAGLVLGGAEGYTAAVIEHYQLVLVKEEGYIYATKQEQEATYERGLRLIRGFFSPRGRRAVTPESGHPLYDAVARLCDSLGIPVVSYAEVRRACGYRFTAMDIARLSHFACREVLLEEDWFRRDSGPLLLFTREGNAPVPCLPFGPAGYELLPVAPDGPAGRVSAGLADTFSPQALMFYRPLPPTRVGIRDLFLLGLKSVYRRDIARFLLLALAGTLVGLLLPVLNEQIYDNFIPLADTPGLVQLCMMVLACLIGNMGFSMVKGLGVFRSLGTMEHTMQSAVFDRLFNLPESFARKYESAELAMRAYGVSSVCKELYAVVNQTVLTALFSFVYLFQMFKHSKKLSWFAILMLLVSAAVIALLGWRAARHEKRQLEVASKANSAIYQLLGGIAKIRIAGVENRALLEYLRPYTETRAAKTRVARIMLVITALSGALGTVYTIVFYYMMIRNNVSLSVGAFTAFTTAFGAFSAAILQLAGSVTTVSAALPTLRRAAPILETLPEYDEDTQLPGDITGDIEVNNLDFAYGEGLPTVLKGLSFRIKPGEYVGVVGASGSGKSTLMKLLLGFEKPQAGKIYYDGMDIDGLDKRELRKKFGVVLQDGKLIAGSIYENITIAAPGATPERVKQVLAEVGLAEDVDALPMGLNTVLTEDGGTISGGQLQRVLIARAIMGRPSILFFDEATSALDNTTQAMVTQSLDKLHATRLVIAHRLSTVINCDRILVMEDGKIAEQGSYRELMAKKGLFHALASRQIV